MGEPSVVIFLDAVGSIQRRTNSWWGGESGKAQDALDISSKPLGPLRRGPSGKVVLDAASSSEHGMDLAHLRK